MYHWIRREILYENDGSFFSSSKSKISILGAPGAWAFWGFIQGYLKMKSFHEYFKMDWWNSLENFFFTSFDAIVF